MIQSKFFEIGQLLHAIEMVTERAAATLAVALSVALAVAILARTTM